MDVKSERARAVIDEIEQHRRDFEAWCRSLSVDELQRPVPDCTWRVQDFISHLATIDATVGQWFAAIAGGAAPDMRSGGDGRPFDIDQWNDAQVAERAGWSLDQIFDEARRMRGPIVELLAGFDDAALDQSIQFGGDSKRAAREIKLIDYLTGWAKHDPIHVNDMIRALPDRPVSCLGFAERGPRLGM
jgi:hypothetical protein